MKSIIFISTLIISGVISLPVGEEEKHRWTLVPDTNGRMHLYDMNPIEVEIEPAFDALNDVIFLLFTRRNPTVGQRITFDMETVRNSNWNSENQARFIIHGWQSNQNTAMNIFMTRDFLERADHNVVVVDWGAGAQTSNYIAARNRVGAVGNVVARMIDFLDADGLTTFDKVNIVGHSLGGHVAGFAGKGVTRGRINAIFATDPAGPLFAAGSASERLDVHDALYTEALHTNAGTLGFDQPITMASFYPNWGNSQPGCGLDVTGACAHERSNLFYSESINSPRFSARRCLEYQQITSRNCPGTGTFATMGGDVAKQARGVFFLQTASAAPFALG